MNNPPHSPLRFSSFIYLCLETSGWKEERNCRGEGRGRRRRKKVTWFSFISVYIYTSGLWKKTNRLKIRTMAAPGAEKCIVDRNPPIKAEFNWAIYPLKGAVSSNTPPPSALVYVPPSPVPHIVSLKGKLRAANNYLNLWSKLEQCLRQNRTVASDSGISDDASGTWAKRRFSASKRECLEPHSLHFITNN